MSDPVGSRPWPKRLRSKVVAAGEAPRLQGYAVSDDLAAHYGFAEVILLALTGTLPEQAEARLFERLLVLLSPAYPGAASVHGASLSRVCGASDAAIFATGAGLLAEATREGGIGHLAWDEAALAEALAALAESSGIEADWPDDAPATDRLERLLARCGLAARWQRTAALTLAALPAALAEAYGWRRGEFEAYPMDLPAYRYTEDDDG